MTELKFVIDDDGFAILETVEGYLQYFRGYRIQLSASAEGVGDRGSSSSVIHHHFRYVRENCSDQAATKFTHLVGLSHVGEALSGRSSSARTNVVQQLKQEPKVFDAFMEHLLSVDFGLDTIYDFSLDITLDNLEPVTLDSLQDLDKVTYLEGVDEGSVSVAIFTIGTYAYVIDARTLKGYRLDFKEFSSAVSSPDGITQEQGFTDGMHDFVTNTLLYVVTFKEEYPSLLPPHYYVNKKRPDSIQPSNIFG